MSVTFVTSEGQRNHARRNQKAVLNQPHPLLALSLTGYWSRRAGLTLAGELMPALWREGPTLTTGKGKSTLMAWAIGELAPTPYRRWVSQQPRMTSSATTQAHSWPWVVHPNIYPICDLLERVKGLVLC